MNYLRAENLSKRYGERLLFENITISVEKGERIALVARNGTGKTNLLNILAGLDEPDSGEVIRSKDIVCTYLPQDPLLPGELTIWEALFNSNDSLLAVVAGYEKAIEASQHGESEETLRNLQHWMEEMDRLNAWDYEARVKQILTKLSINQYDQKVETLSGGQKKRLALARILIQNPDMIIMDEPTNHLDVDMIEWLEGYLKGSDMTLLLVTHDRYFLDGVCTEIIELDRGKLFTYRGNYSYFLEKKADREMRDEREIEKAKNLMRKELEWMRRQPKARGTKSKARIDAFYDLKDKASQKVRDEKVELNVKMQRLGGKILELHHVQKAFGDKKIVDDFSYLLKPGERIGVVGRNGVGKTTFLNMLMALEQPDKGHISTGDTIIYGYYSQSGLKLKEDKRVLEVVKDIAEYIELGRGEKLTATQLCKRFLFDDKMQHTYVSKLSGGEKRRLFLLTVLMKNPNFLILDEPTNDLDIETLNVLEEFLESFKGCLIVVTHDRYFMDKVVDHLWIFEGEGVIRDFNGNYQDYLDEAAEKKAGLKQEKVTPVAEPVEVKTEKPVPAKRKLSYNEQRELELLGKELPELETKKQKLEEQLLSGSSNHEDLMQWTKEIQELGDLIDEKSMRWLELSE